MIIQGKKLRNLSSNLSSTETAEILKIGKEVLNKLETLKVKIKSFNAYQVGRIIITS